MGIRDSHKIVLRGNKEIEFGKETYEILRGLMFAPIPPDALEIRGHIVRRDCILWAGPKTVEGSEKENV